MIFNLPKKEDRTLLYELYYIHGICFGALMGPKERKEDIQLTPKTGRTNISSSVQKFNNAQVFKVKKTDSFSSILFSKEEKKESFQWNRIPTQRSGRVQPNRSVLNKRCNLR